MPDFERTRATFSWEQVHSELGSSADRFNIAHLAVERHAAGPLRDHVALRWKSARNSIPNRRSADSYISTWGRSRGGRSDAGPAARGCDRIHLPRAWPRAGARYLGRIDHGGDVRETGRLEPRARRIDASLRRQDEVLRRQRDCRRRPPDHRGPGAGRPATREQDGQTTAHYLLLLRGWSGCRG